jgi:Ca2+:H+ antiporter
MLSSLMKERVLFVGLAAAILAYATEHSLLEMGRLPLLVAAFALVVAIILVSTRIAHHAEILASKVGDPYGTMILTLAAVLVEVVVLAIMMQGETSPTLVRDTIYAAVMLDINGILGLAALLGGIRHGEQPYNDDSGKTYGVMILTAMGISMVVAGIRAARKLAPLFRLHHRRDDCALRRLPTHAGGAAQLFLQLRLSARRAEGGPAEQGTG